MDHGFLKSNSNCRVPSVVDHNHSGFCMGVNGKFRKFKSKRVHAWCGNHKRPAIVKAPDNCIKAIVAAT